MSSRQELLRQIESLELARNLLDDEIARTKALLAGIEADIDRKWRENDFAQQPRTRKLAEYLRSLGFLIADCQTAAPSDFFYKIAKQVWNCRQEAVPFFKALFQAGTANREFDYPVSSRTSAAGVGFLNLCARMQTEGIFSFTRKGDTIHVVPRLTGEQRTFLSGGWAEEVNRYLVRKVLTEYAGRRKLTFKVFWDLRLKSVDSDPGGGPDMQLDLAVQINDRFYVIETKAGVTLEIRKWMERAAIFNQNGNRFMTCSASSGADHRFFRPYTLLSFENIETQLPRILDRDFPPPAEAAVPSQSPASQKKTRGEANSSPRTKTRNGKS